MPPARCTPALLLGVALLWAASLAHAADPMDPARPDVTNGTTTVGRGVFQIETGVEYAHSSVGAAVETTLAGRGPDYAVRAGLSTRFGAKP